MDRYPKWRIDIPGKMYPTPKVINGPNCILKGVPLQIISIVLILQVKKFRMVGGMSSCYVG